MLPLLPPHVQQNVDSVVLQVAESCFTKKRPLVNGIEYYLQRIRPARLRESGGLSRVEIASFAYTELSTEGSSLDAADSALSFQVPVIPLETRLSAIEAACSPKPIDNSQTSATGPALSAGELFVQSCTAGGGIDANHSEGNHRSGSNKLVSCPSSLSGGREAMPPPLERFEIRRAAAVLVPLCRVHDKPSILFTERTDFVGSHKGQVSFPGGHLERDETPEAAAVRETKEELGSSTGPVTIVGSCRPLFAMTGTVVFPVVGFLHKDVGDLSHLELSAREVRRVFTLPLTHLLDEKNCRYIVMRRLGFAMHLPFYSGGPQPVWGLTGIILDGVLQQLFKDTAAPTAALVPVSLKSREVARSQQLPTNLDPCSLRDQVPPAGVADFTADDPPGDASGKRVAHYEEHDITCSQATEPLAAKGSSLNSKPTCSDVRVGIPYPLPGSSSSSNSGRSVRVAAARRRGPAWSRPGNKQ